MQRDYRSLLEAFPADRPGYRLDHHLSLIGDQPMTVGLVLASESIRMQRDPSKSPARRVKTSMQWLLKA